MKDLHILKGLVVGLKTCIIEIVQLIVKVIYYIIRNIDNGVAYLYMKLPRLAKVGIIYLMIILSTIGIFSMVPKNVDTKVIQTNVSNIVEKVETTEQVEETETTEQVAIVEQTNATCKIDNETACYIYNSAIEYGLEHNQALLVVAISRHETGGWSSSLYVNNNNFGGLYNSSAKKFFSYETKEDGLNAMLNTLSKSYFNKGLTTIESIGAKYCPVGANDNGTNQYWVGSVTKIYNQYQALYE
jgi:hypothetical protein